MKLKPGVRLKNLTPQMALAAGVVADVYAVNGGEAVITSANDSTHGVNSLHYSGCALDFRTKTFDGNKSLLRDRVKEALGDEFDVVLEDVGQPNEHLHVEYDPK